MGKRSLSRSDEDPDIPTDAHASAHRLFGRDLFRRTEPQDGRAYGGQAVLVVSGDGIVSEVVQAPEISGGAAPSSLIGNPVDEIWPGEPAGRLVKSVKRTLRSRQVESDEVSTNPGGDHYEIMFIPRGRDSVMLVARDISERKTEFSRIERLAYLDDTTKLPNRQFLFEELERCTDLLRLHEGRAAVLCFDISSTDNEANSLNSKQHDKIFVELASRLTHELRGANVLDVDDYERYSVAARIEYSQFGVILPLIESGADAEGVARRLVDILEQPIKMAHHEASVTARAGIALFPQDGSDAEALYANAVAAMEDARNNQATPFKFHSGTVRLRALQRQDLELELRTALDKDEFAVEFLPTIEAKSLKITAVEALLRWPHNVLGAKSIKKVISIAENTGLILPIGDWVLRKSCEALRQWHLNGWSDLRISVNLSVQEFSRDDLAERISSVLKDNVIDPGFLDIEITEYTLFRDAMRRYSMCSKLKALGVGLIVDDYGTGACSLAHVARSPVDAIKIDNSFVANAAVDENDRAACAAIAAMARELGIRIIAEGVETEVLAALLVEMGCDALQGYAISKPVSFDGVHELLARSVDK